MRNRGSGHGNQRPFHGQERLRRGRDRPAPCRRRGAQGLVEPAAPGFEAAGKEGVEAKRSAAVRPRPDRGRSVGQRAGPGAGRAVLPPPVEAAEARRGGRRKGSADALQSGKPAQGASAGIRSATSWPLWRSRKWRSPLRSHCSQPRMAGVRSRRSEAAAVGVDVGLPRPQQEGAGHAFRDGWRGCSGWSGRSAVCPGVGVGRG